MLGSTSLPVVTGPRRRSTLVVALCALVVLPLALAQTRSRAATPADTAPEPSCGWTLQVSPDKINAFYPDEAATYFVAALPIPVGGTIEIDGQYPHARYTSLVTYSPQTSAIDGLNDQAIAPDPGSTDPFIAGARRDLPHRSYTVHVVDAQVPAAGRAPNTLYTEDAAGNKSTSDEHIAVLALRVYIPDTGLDLEGGVPLPTLALDEADGTKTVLPDCPDLQPSTQLTEAIAGFSTPVNVPGLGAFGTNPPDWRKFTNLLTAAITNFADTQLFSTSLFPILQPISDSALPSGGFFENPDNNYISTSTDAGFGEVLVLRGRAPTTPHTFAGEKRMGTGQLRYWSVCTESAQTTAFYGCAYDEQIPVDKHGDYTIVVSSTAERPTNATLSCGAMWLPAGPLPQTLLLMRNMLPSPTFKQAIQNVTPGQEKQQMGKYYPNGTYYADAAAYEQLGCA